MDFTLRDVCQNFETVGKLAENPKFQQFARTVIPDAELDTYLGKMEQNVKTVPGYITKWVNAMGEVFKGLGNINGATTQFLDVLTKLKNQGRGALTEKDKAVARIFNGLIRLEAVVQPGSGIEIVPGFNLGPKRKA